MNRLSDYDFPLATELIASRPLETRSSSRLLVLKEDASPNHDYFSNIDHYLVPGDVLVVNDTKVMKARIYAYKPTGGVIELLVVRRINEHAFYAMVKGKRKIKNGTKLALGSPDAQDFLQIQASVAGEDNVQEVFCSTDIAAYMAKSGEMPLPHYFQRRADAEDEHRYQTIFSHHATLGAVAAPTAGLHFDNHVLAKLKEKGVRVATVTLHIGPGTFVPVRNEDITEHKMHAEYFSMSAECARLLNDTRDAGGRVVAVGTTSVRVLEEVMHQAQKNGHNQFFPCEGKTALFITPGYRFLAISALITNFHLPRSTLFMLVSAVAGRERMLNAYAEAIAQRYRFFSYGDACYLEVLGRAGL